MYIYGVLLVFVGSLWCLVMLGVLVFAYNIDLLFS